MKSCNSCGKCCIKYGDGQLAATNEDLEVWQTLRPDIAAFVSGGEIWFDPKTEQQLEYCPWLQKEPDQPHTCAIYFDRPEDCRVYPATVADMVRDDCEMLEDKDRSNRTAAQLNLERIRLASE